MWGGGEVGGNEEIREGQCVVPFNYDLLHRVQSSDDPVGELTERVVEELQVTYQYSEEDIDPIRSDPVFHDSIQREWYRVQRGMRGRKQALPRTLKIRFGQPATRTAKGKPIANENSDDGGRLED